MASTVAVFCLFIAISKRDSDSFDKRHTSLGRLVTVPLHLGHNLAIYFAAGKLRQYPKDSSIPNPYACL